MSEFDYVIVGGGLTAASAVDGIREVDQEGTIAVLSDEIDPPYHRPPLSKEYLQTLEAPRELLHVKPSGWFEDQSGVSLFLLETATTLDARGLRVRTDSDRWLDGGRILLAMGGRPRTLDVPGADLTGVHTLRTADDAEAIRKAARSAERVVLIGAGFIGMELAATLTGLEVPCVVVDIADRVWSSVFPPPLSGFLQRYYEERGVRFLLGSGVEALVGDERLRRVVLDSGEEIPAELAIVGVGIEPEDRLAESAGLAVRNGIVVDSYCETTAGHIYAAGDVARFPDPVFGDLTRVEHWDHAKAHGKTAGRNMAGEREPYEHLSYFFSHTFDLSFNVFGRTADADTTLVSGELGSGRSVIYCATDDRLSGIILINANDAMDESRELVRARPDMEEIRRKLGELVG